MANNNPPPASSAAATATATPWDSERSYFLSQLRSLSVWTRNPVLSNEALRILELWHRDLDFHAWRRVRKRVIKEFNEAEPCLSYAAGWVRASSSASASSSSSVPALLSGAAEREANANAAATAVSAGSKATVIDLCSGYGLTSMFLSELLPPHLVDQIYLLDKMWPCSNDPNPPKVNVGHIRGRQWPIPLSLRKTNIKASREIRQVHRYVLDRAPGPVLVLGIHLCKALSVHAIKLYQSSDKITALVLKPCCLPGKGMMFRKNPIIWKFENGYEFRPGDVYRCGDGMGGRVRDKTLDGDVAGDGDEKEEKEKVMDEPVVDNSDGEVLVSGDGDDNEDEGGATVASKNGCGHNFGKHHTNERFDRWVDHLRRACEDETRCRVCVRNISITRHHFQNQFIICERIVPSASEDGEEESVR